MMALFQDTNFWVLISFIIFAVFALRYGKDKALSILDNKIDAIRTELETAENLRVEAQELLAEYQRKHKDAMNEAANIIARAKDHAESLRLKAEEDLAETMKRREAQLQEKLQRIEQNAVMEIKAYTAQLAINAAKDVLAKDLDAKSDKDLIDNTLNTISKTLN